MNIDEFLYNHSCAILPDLSWKKERIFIINTLQIILTGYVPGMEVLPANL